MSDRPIITRPSMPPTPAGWKAFDYFGHRGFVSDEQSPVDPDNYDEEEDGTRVYRDPEARFKVYMSDEGDFSISEHGTWITGIYADLETAIAAFGVRDELLHQLQATANGRGDHVITAADLAAATAGST